MQCSVILSSRLSLPLLTKRKRASLIAIGVLCGGQPGMNWHTLWIHMPSEVNGDSFTFVWRSKCMSQHLSNSLKLDFFLVLNTPNLHHASVSQPPPTSCLSDSGIADRILRGCCWVAGDHAIRRIGVQDHVHAIEDPGSRGNGRGLRTPMDPPGNPKRTPEGVLLLCSVLMSRCRECSWLVQNVNCIEQLGTV